MANTINEIWLFPPNWDGSVPDTGGWKKVVKRFTCLSGGDDETDVVKLDISDLRNVDGRAPTRTVIEKIKFSQTGFTSITLNWDRIPKDLIYIISANQGEIDFTQNGGLADPGEAGDATGDILLSSAGSDAGDVYDITLSVRLK